MTGYVLQRVGKGLLAISVASALVAGLAIRVRAQQQANGKEPLIFDVASVKPTPPDERRGIVHQPPGGQSYEALGAPLRMIMTVAYTVTDRQISGGPDCSIQTAGISRRKRSAAARAMNCMTHWRGCWRIVSS